MASQHRYSQTIRFWNLFLDWPPFRMDLDCYLYRLPFLGFQRFHTLDLQSVNIFYLVYDLFRCVSRTNRPQSIHAHRLISLYILFHSRNSSSSHGLQKLLVRLFTVQSKYEMQLKFDLEHPSNNLEKIWTIDIASVAVALTRSPDTLFNCSFLMNLRKGRINILVWPLNDRAGLLHHTACLPFISPLFQQSHPLFAWFPIRDNVLGHHSSPRKIYPCWTFNATTIY